MFALAVVLLAQLRSVDVSQPPWDAAMARLQSDDPGGAARELERVAEHDGSLTAWQRAYAWRWAGQLSLRAARTDEGRRDFARAIESDPQGFDARMATMHLGELAMQRGDDREAARWLERVENDPDTIVRTYARDRLRTVRERVKRTWLRRLTTAAVLAGAFALAARAAQRSRWKGRARGFGRALLVAEGIAIAGALVVPRAMSQLALSGWMLAAVPMGLAGATLWATRRDRVVPEVIAWVLYLIVAVAAFHLAWDVLWWSVERPIQ